MTWKVSRLLSLLKPAAYIDPIQDQNVIAEEYKYWRLRICYSLFIGYAMYYLTRKSFAVIMPVVALDLHLSKAQLGALLSSLSIAYGISKLVSGILSDRSNPRYFMSIGLMITGILNILFAFSSSFISLWICWTFNGFFQALGWPACCKFLTFLFVNFMLSPMCYCLVMVIWDRGKVGGLLLLSVSGPVSYTVFTLLPAVGAPTFSGLSFFFFGFLITLGRVIG